MADDQESPSEPDVDTGPGTAPFVPDFDTDSHPSTAPFVPDFDTDSHPVSSPVTAEADSEAAEAPPIEQVTAPVQPVTVPGRYYYLKWWKLVLVVLAVWMAAAAIGPGLFYWWTQDRSLYKTPVVFVVLIYVVVCTVVGLLLAMVEGRPLVSALAIAVMSAPFASVAATSPFYGAFYCSHIPDACFVGVIPF